ncbi:hypothetical protein MBLNU459_g5958t2 [Dothideomycetes sp. NU459]
MPADGVLDAAMTEDTATVLSKGRATIIISQLIGLQLFTSFCNGIVVVGLPAIARTLDLKAGLLLWPTSVFYLTAGSCLMLAGSLADVMGTRPMMLAANVLLVASALGCGLARTGGELIAFRGLQGVTSAMAVPASVSIISTSVAYGRPRNLGFACLGFSGPLGFLIGLVLGGVFVDTVGWRPAFYLAAATSFVLCVIGLWVLQPLSPDVLFTVGLLVISAVFPPGTQALGGAVFNTCSQLGTSIGLTITAVISDSRTAAAGDSDKTSPNALMTGYRAVFWALFVWMVAVCVVGAWGLRRVGKIGMKQD